MNFKAGLLAIIGSIVVVSQFARVFTSPTPLHDKSITFVLAHPDDESMFFGPTVRHVLDESRQNTVSFLVLSNGNADGLGETREQEMLAAAAAYGVPAERVKVVDDERLPDSMEVEWDHEVVAAHVAEAAAQWGTQAIITFDENGVSHHPNHKQASIGSIRYGSRTIASDPEFAVFTLYSVPLYRKYLFSLDSIMSRIQRLPQVDYVLINGQFDYHAVRTALLLHESQMTWYRKLWSMFSRYMIVNDLGNVNLRRVLETNYFHDKDAAQMYKAVAAHDEAAKESLAAAAEESRLAALPTKKEKTRYRERRVKTPISNVTRQKPSFKATAPADAAAAAPSVSAPSAPSAPSAAPAPPAPSAPSEGHTAHDHDEL